VRATASGVALQQELRQEANDGVDDRADTRSAPAAAWLTLLVRALDLERACLLVADGPGRPYRLLAAHGRGAPRLLDLRAEPPDGPWSATVTLDADGGPAGLLLLARAGGAPLAAADRALVRDLADGVLALLARRRLEDDLSAARALLAQADRLSTLGTLAAGIAHEIRNPLVSVRTFIQLVPERLHDEEFRTGFRELALAEIERICGLITELLAFSRPSAAEREPVDVSALVAQTLRLLDAEAHKRGVALRAEVAGDVPAVQADEAQLKQVVLNVVLNAIQASPSRSAVVVRTGAGASTGAVIEVEDAGPGIPEERAARIFDPFFTTKEAGSGLGLFIAQRIVTDHGGSIDARPRAGGGTMFAIRLPADAEACRALG